MKRAFIFLILGFIFLLTGKTTLASDENFFVSLTSNYKVQKEGVMTMTNTIEVVNQKTEVYSPTFSFSVSGMKPENITAFESGVALPVALTQKDDISIINITFKRAVVGKGARRKFTLTLTDASLVEKNGDVWEIRLPKIEGVQNFLNAKATLAVPTDFGDLASASIPPKSITKGVLEFDREALTHKISVAYGKFQVYQMLLTYEARNDSDRVITREIPLPPDTSYQTVTIRDITPRPKTVVTDPDGNWLAIFELKPKVKQSVIVRGSVKVSNDPKNLYATPEQTLISNTRPDHYWESDNPKIASEIKNLSSIENIYKFVVNTLHYNYDRVGSSVERYGALRALTSPTDALCAEFTDLFVALSRGHGIPAREINGYALVADSHLTPLSLVSDVLHAWPEYWDAKLGRWVAVDPTWEKTSGVDYFSKMDTKHIALSIHGMKSNSPLIPIDTSDAKKAIRFTLEPPLGEEAEPLKVSFEALHTFSFLKSSFEIRIENTTGNALYNQKLEVKDTKNKIVFSETLVTLPPFGEYTHVVTLPNGLMGQSLPVSLTLIRADEQIKMNVDKGIAIASQLGVLFICVIAILCIITLQARK